MEQNSISVRFNPNKRNDILAVNNTQNLLIGLISSMKTGLFVDSLETGIEHERLHRLLAETPQLKQEAAIIEMLSLLRNEGERTSYSILIPYLLTANNGDETERILRERFFGIELFIRKCNNLHHFITCIKADQTFKIGEEELKRGVLAWDMGRMVCLTRIAYDAGFIDESLAWNYICSAGQQCIQAFNDWTELGKSFLLGQAMEATEKRKQELYIRLYRQATENPNSPWKKRTLK